MKKIILASLLALAPLVSLAAGEGPQLDKAGIDLEDKASLQRGAGHFFNYCVGCHSLKFMRYNRMGQDLGISDEVLKSTILPSYKKAGDTITVSMPEDLGKKWFGKAPPDLSVTARYRGTDWIYTYLRSFYLDDKRPYGVNNLVFPDVGMPHVLWELEGAKKAVYKTETNAEGNEHQVFEGFEQVKPGKLTPAEYDRFARDLTNFLTYVAEPVRVEREKLGIWVILFLLVFTGVAYLLKKEYWKDVH
ncbi:cytochrome c1 [Thioalbus denitrificans]|uniref:Ubiquinol-cytochrome c reductase cytochrome c1 subunit n=1 Tax=Thioalbus denitrificans TaxID=547122 RepID=A0A369CI93_9GAMM|nr:cytochrome c1 [Thioalbus denitrificans]RCX33413.1 ubiquinol-cytochrome c reductase cytochrome c1 subunit [Thioalbus denitrificans]